ncbi:hypothetical protein D3C84_1188790 [compost metagenome]
MFVVGGVATGIDDLAATENVATDLQRAVDLYRTSQGYGGGLEVDSLITDHQRTATDLYSNGASGQFDAVAASLPVIGQ